MGSSTSFKEACTTRSATVGIPSRRNLPSALGIIRSRTREGRNPPDLRSSLKPSRNAAALLTERALSPSTPAVRAPLLPLTRSHATSRKAGSQTRLNKSSNRRPDSKVAQRCSFNCKSSTRASASTRLGHDAPVFTSDLLGLSCHHEIAGPLRHVAGFPDPGLLRVLRPTPAASVDDEPSQRQARSQPHQGLPMWFPCSSQNRSSG